jgi:peptide/nickel transport system ATP-binding protein
LEIANIEDFEGGGEQLRHPYTKALWNALPQNKFKIIKGTQPLQTELADDICVFYERCPRKTEICTRNIPKLEYVNGGLVRCNNVS